MNLSDFQRWANARYESDDGFCFPEELVFQLAKTMKVCVRKRRAATWKEDLVREAGEVMFLCAKAAYMSSPPYGGAKGYSLANVPIDGRPLTVDYDMSDLVGEALLVATKQYENFVRLDHKRMSIGSESDLGSILFWMWMALERIGSSIEEACDACVANHTAKGVAR